MKKLIEVLFLIAIVLVLAAFFVLTPDISSVVVPSERYRTKIPVVSPPAIYVYAKGENTCTDETAALQKSFIEIENELRETIRELGNRFDSQHNDKHVWKARALHAERRMQDILRSTPSCSGD